jgi:AhpD family alkylhydroperoxidase
MQPTTVKADSPVLTDKVRVLIAIGAATAANCIPCFDHLYEKALTAGVTQSEIMGAADIAGKVKKGAHQALVNSIDELIGSGVAADAVGCLGDKQPCNCV